MLYFLLLFILNINKIYSFTENNTFIQDEEGLLYTYYNEIYYSGPITTESCFNIQQQIHKIIEEKYNDKDNYETIKLHIQSMGGLILPAIGLVDFIRNSIIPIDTYINGFVASAASLIVISGYRTYMTINSVILINSLYIAIEGEMNFNEFEENYINIKNIMNIIKNIYKEKTILSDDKLDNLLKSEYILNSTECLKYNFIDYII